MKTHTLTVTLTVHTACDSPSIIRTALVSDLCGTTIDYDCTEMLPGGIEGKREQCTLDIIEAECDGHRCS